MFASGNASNLAPDFLDERRESRAFFVKKILRDEPNAPFERQADGGRLRPRVLSRTIEPAGRAAVEKCNVDVTFDEAVLRQMGRKSIGRELGQFFVAQGVQDRLPPPEQNNRS